MLNNIKLYTLKSLKTKIKEHSQTISKADKGNCIATLPKTMYVSKTEEVLININFKAPGHESDERLQL